MFGGGFSLWKTFLALTAVVSMVLVLSSCGGGTAGMSSNSGGTTGGGGTGSGTGSGSGSGGSSGGDTSSSVCSGISVGQGASLNGFRPFPASSAWNQDISSAGRSRILAAIINFIGPSIHGLHPDFGSTKACTTDRPWEFRTLGSMGRRAWRISISPPMGMRAIPGRCRFRRRKLQRVKAIPNPGSGDRHVLVLDNGTCFLYELGTKLLPNNDGSWGLPVRPRCGGFGKRRAAALDVDLPPMRQGWRFFRGWCRYDEVAAGAIQHAIRFYAATRLRQGWRHRRRTGAATSSDASAPPMGMRLRLQAETTTFRDSQPTFRSS